MDEKKLVKLYMNGEAREVVEKVREMPEKDVTPGIQLILGWSLFRLGLYNEAMQVASSPLVAGTKEAMGLISQIAGYVTKDDKVLEEALKLNTPSTFNAFVIRARDFPIGEGPIAPKDALRVSLSFIRKVPSDIASVNLLNNTARLYYAAGGEEEMLIAIGLWETVISLYGDKNYHHRGSVLFWVSKAYKVLGIQSLAIEAAEKSVELWDIQCELDPSNKQFGERMKGAHDWLEELKK